MGRVLVTGGNGFIATHVLDCLLSRGHSVTVTVRSEKKGELVRARLAKASGGSVEVAIVPDFTKHGAFDDAVKAEPGFDAVMHIASPFFFGPKDAQQEIIDPCILGTKNLLQSIKSHAPSVKKVIITSSFVSILNGYEPNSRNYKYSAEDWNPLTMEDALKNPSLNGYRVAKVYAEKEVWSFVEREKPNFSLVAICPALAFGPVIQPIDSVDQLNTSSQRLNSFITGRYKNGMPDTGFSFFIWIDVRDLALAHVKAMEASLCGNKRYLLAAGHFTNKEINKFLKREFPEYKDLLPSGEGNQGGYPEEGVYGFDNGPATIELGLTYRPFEECIKDAIVSLRDAHWRKDA